MKELIKTYKNEKYRLLLTILEIIGQVSIKIFNDAEAKQN